AAEGRSSLSKPVHYATPVLGSHGSEADRVRRHGWHIRCSAEGLVAVANVAEGGARMKILTTTLSAVLALALAFGPFAKGAEARGGGGAGGSGASSGSGASGGGG